jgi:hypothetical protein
MLTTTGIYDQPWKTEAAWLLQGEEAGSRASSPGRAPSMQKFPRIHVGGDPGEQPDTATGHHMVPSGNAVRLSRKDAWARFLAYEVGHSSSPRVHAPCNNLKRSNPYRRWHNHEVCCTSVKFLWV